MPIHSYTNWNRRPSDQKEQIEPFRKYVGDINEIVNSRS